MIEKRGICLSFYFIKKYSTNNLIRKHFKRKADIFENKNQRSTLKGI